MDILKLDGRKEEFQREKIEKAIFSAFNQVYGDTSWDKSIAFNIADEIEKEAQESEELFTVEGIHNLIEVKLLDYNEKKVSEAYHTYRKARSLVRERNSKIVKNIMSRIHASNTQNSNANVDENSFSGREKEASGDLLKIVALDFDLPKDVSEAHQNMLIYQHDNDKTSLGEHNCLNIDFKKLFEEGFSTRNGDVRPPRSFSSACQLFAVIFQCQSQVQFGGVGTVHVDLDLVPFVKFSFLKAYVINIVKESNKFDEVFENIEDMDIKDVDNLIEDIAEDILDSVGLTKKDIVLDNKDKLNEHTYRCSYMDLIREMSQACQGFFHNLNTLESRQGSQVPFTSINLGRDTSTEGRLVSKYMLKASLEGIGRLHRTSIFPISIFQYKQGVNANPSDPNYDLKKLAIKSMAKRIYPNWCNGDWSEAHEVDGDPDTWFSTMGCRTMLGYDINGLGYKRVGRGNNVPNTIILPKLGIEYGICRGERKEPDLDGFWSAFEDTLKLTEKGLLARYEIMRKQSPKAAPFMYANGTIAEGQNCKGTVEESLKHNTLAIGYIGIAEMCQALFGVNQVHSKEAYDFALSVVKRINEFAKEASQRNHLNFSCYATPAESLCMTAAKALRKQYGVIEGVTDRNYITNSHHVPVWETVSIFEKLAFEAPFCKYPTGGCITYVELDSTFIENQEAIEKIIDYAFTKLNIPYLAFNFPLDTCLDCGYQGEIKLNCSCPACGSKNVERLRRVTGYITTDYSHFNDGKFDETNDRVKHSLFTNFNKEGDMNQCQGYSIEELLKKI